MSLWTESVPHSMEWQIRIWLFQTLFETLVWLRLGWCVQWCVKLRSIEDVGCILPNLCEALVLLYSRVEWLEAWGYRFSDRNLHTDSQLLWQSWTTVVLRSDHLWSFVAIHISRTSLKWTKDGSTLIINMINVRRLKCPICDTRATQID